MICLCIHVYIDNFITSFNIHAGFPSKSNSANRPESGLAGSALAVSPALSLGLNRGWRISHGPQHRLDAGGLSVPQEELRRIGVIQLDFPDFGDLVVTRQGEVLPPGPGGVRLEIDALGDEDIGFAGGLLNLSLV